MLEVDLAQPAGRTSRSTSPSRPRRRHRPVRPLGLRQDDARQRDRRARCGRIAAASWSTATRCSTPSAGIDRAGHRRRIGYVFQDARLFPHLTVRQNLLYGRWFAARRERRVGLERGGRAAGHRRTARPPARHAVGRREAAGRDRPGAAGAARACCCWTSRSPRSTQARKARDPALSRAAVRRGRDPDRLCQPRARRGGAARDHHGAALGGRVVARAPSAEVMARVDLGAAATEVDGGCHPHSRSAGATRRTRAHSARHTRPARLSCPASTCRRRHAVRVRIDARDVVPGAGLPPSGVSIRNQLRATVAALGAPLNGQPRSAST